MPSRQIETGELTLGETYRVALISEGDDTAVTTPTDATVESGLDTEPVDPPVAEGEIREVKIENIGDQGDDIEKIDRGYVVIVPETTVGERVAVELETVRDNVAFADVVERDL